MSDLYMQDMPNTGMPGGDEDQNAGSEDTGKDEGDSAGEAQA